MMKPVKVMVFWKLSVLIPIKHEVSPEQACNDSTFCCKLTEGEVRLKKNHPYYHQVQLQLYIGYDCFKWCDFCIFTCKGLSVQRIFPYTNLQEDEIPVLEPFFFDDFLLPEIMVLNKYKPRYYL